MAIGRVSGSMLVSNLDRQGTDLQFTTGNNPLVYMDFAQFKVGINTNTGIAQTLTINGNLSTSNVLINGLNIGSKNNLDTLAFTSPVNLGNVGNVKINGGSVNYILYTDGSGNLNWTDITTLSSNAGLAGNTIELGTPLDSSLTGNAAYEGWTTSTKVTDAIDNLNQLALNLGQNTFVGNVQFTANVTANASPVTIRFTGTAAGNPNTYYWDFGDGTTSNVGPIVNKTYSNASGGLFTVYYRASNSSGTWGGNATLGAIGSVDDFIRTNYITLYTPNPIPSFTANTTSLNSGNTILLSDTSTYLTSYNVYWGDGTITSAAAPGTSQTHTYTNLSGDSTYNIILQASSTTAGPTPVNVNSAATTEKVYSTHTPVITANVPYVINLESDGGGTVNFTNGTATNPGAASIFGAQQVYQYWWSDNTANSNVAIGSAASGDTGTSLAHKYTLTPVQQSAGANVVYNTQMLVYNGHTSSPFHSTNVSVTVVPSVRSNIQARANVVSDRTGDTVFTGYRLIDYNGYDRSLFTFATAAQNTTTYNWGWGDSTSTGNLSEGASGTVTGGNITHSYLTSTDGTKTANLTAYGSPGSIFQTNSKAVTITISAAPTVSNLSTKSLTLSTASQYTNAPYLVASNKDNTNGNVPAAGTAITRYTSTTPIVTNTITQANSSTSGTLTAVINGTANGSTQFFTGNSRAGTYTSLVVSLDQDAHSYTPATYPTGFYKLFDAYVSKALSEFGVGYNDITLSHTSAGKSTNAGFVKDDVTSVPTLITSGVTVSNVTATTIRTVSGIPYYQAGGNVVIQGLQVYNWIGQTFYGPVNVTPMTVVGNTVQAEGTSGTITTSQTKTYAVLNTGTNYLTGGVPNANVGNVISNSYTFGNIYLNIDGTAAAVANANVTLQNVNGTSTAVTLPTYLNVYSAAYTGLDETSIACAAGSTVGNTQIAKRIVLTSANVSTPVYANTGTNYYNSAAWTSTSTVAGTTEAVVRWGNLKVNTTNYSSGQYLPVGPDLSIGGNRTTTQSFKFAFQRPIMQNLKVIFTGNIAGMYVAAPGTKLTDTASTLNGWLDANVAYAGSGFPGANTGAGGNGSTGCAVGTPVPLNTTVSNIGYTMTLGSADLSSSTYHQCLINIVLGPNSWVSNVYVGSYQ